MKRLKTMFNIPLVKSYKNTEEVYEMGTNSSRILQSMREINNYEFNYINSYFCFKVNLNSLKLKPIHMTLLGRGLRNNSKISVTINSCSFFSKSLIQLKPLLTQFDQVTFSFYLVFSKANVWLEFLHVLSVLKTWKGKRVIFTLLKRKKESWNMVYEMETLEKKFLSIFVRNSKKFWVRNL